MHDELKLEAVYIAARFSRRHECNALAQELKARGHTITSRWVKPDVDGVEPVGPSELAPCAERRRFAMEDVEDVRAADWCISLMEEPRGGGRGGRHIEFGMALGLGKRLSIIGPRETVFHHLDEVEQFESVEELLAAPSRTLPPANTEADVERVARAIGEGRRQRCGGYPWEGDPNLDPWLTYEDRTAAHAAISALSLTRPAGGEEMDLRQALAGLVKWADNVCRAHHLVPGGQKAVEAARAALTKPPAEGEEDKARLDWLNDECADVQFFAIPTGGDDADVGVRVVGHFQGNRPERVLGEVYVEDVRKAIDVARATVAEHGIYSDEFRTLSSLPVRSGEA